MKILFVSEKCDMSSFVASSIFTHITKWKIENYFSSADGTKPEIYEYILGILGKKGISARAYEKTENDFTAVVCVNAEASSVQNNFSKDTNIYSVNTPILPNENHARKEEIAEVYFDLLYAEIMSLIQKEGMICMCGCQKENKHKENSCNGNGCGK